MITKFKIFEQIEDIDPYGEEDWNYVDKFIRLRIIFDGDDVYLKYKEMKEEDVPQEPLDYINRIRCAYVTTSDDKNEWTIFLKKVNDLLQIQVTTLNLLKILGEKNKEILGWIRTNKKVPKKNLFMNILKLNSQVKPLMGMMGDEWFEHLKEISEEE